MRAMTVDGAVDAGRLGVVLPHEHLSLDLRFLGGARADRRPLAVVPAAQLRRRPMDFLTNLDLREERTAVAEVGAFQRSGGRTIVELTPIDLGRDARSLARIAAATGVQVIMGTAYYVRASHPPSLSRMTTGQIADRFVSDIEQGVDGVRAGVIGEIGTGDPLDPQEVTVVLAAAEAHLRTGCPINLHLAGGCREVFTVLDLIEGAGVTDLSSVVVSHMDVVLDLARQREVAERGAMVEYDTFGHEAYPDSRGNVMPRDEERVAGIAQLVQWGLGDHVLVSQDVCLRSLWRSYGGHGYDNLLRRVAPMMRAAGIDEAVQAALMVHNPARVLAFLPDR